MSLSSVQPNLTRNPIWRGLELLILFVGIPLLYRFELIPFHKSIPLLLGGGYCFLMLWRDTSFDRRRFRINGFKDWKKLGLIWLGFAVISNAVVATIFPDRLFLLVHENPLLLLIIWIFYPLWSAYPQELIFRAFFFHRYDALFPNVQVAILVNAILFSFSHIIFQNWIALAGTFLISFVFARTYLKSKSLSVVALEHSLIGNWVFTVGLGQYFYLPMS
ncbi:MAG: CPBP family intramembrane glutamic endopeptidase [Bacteroidota bacterium]